MTALARTWRDPLYRALFLVQVLQGIAGGATFPLSSLWVTQDLGADAFEAGLMRTVSGIVGMLYGLILGATSDRDLRRTRWIVGAIALGVVARVAMVGVHAYPLGVALYSLVSMAGYTMVFGLLGDWLRHRRDPDAPAITTAVRLAYSIGWLVGPIAGSTIVAASGFGPLFAIAAVAQAASLVVAWRGFRDAPAPEATPPAAPSGGVARRAAPLLFFSLATLCVTSAEPSRFVVLPLLVTEGMREPITSVGWLFTIGGFWEVPLFLLVARWATPRRVVPLLAAGLAVEAVYYLGLGASAAFWQLAALELLFSFAIATTNGIGVLYVQELAPRRAGLALGIYNATYQIGPIVASPLMGYAATALGWAVPFWVAAGLAATSVGFLLLSARARQHAA